MSYLKTVGIVWLASIVVGGTLALTHANWVVLNNIPNAAKKGIAVTEELRTLWLREQFLFNINVLLIGMILAAIILAVFFYLDLRFEFQQNAMSRSYGRQTIPD